MPLSSRGKCSVGFSVGSQRMNILQKVDKNNFQKNWRRNADKNHERIEKAGSQWVLGWVLNGFSVGSQQVLSEYSRYSWVLCIFEYSGGSQVGIPRVRGCSIAKYARTIISVLQCI